MQCRRAVEATRKELQYLRGTRTRAAVVRVRGRDVSRFAKRASLKMKFEGGVTLHTHPAVASRRGLHRSSVVHASKQIAAAKCDSVRPHSSLQQAHGTPAHITQCLLTSRPQEEKRGRVTFLAHIVLYTGNSSGGMYVGTGLLTPLLQTQHLMAFMVVSSCALKRVLHVLHYVLRDFRHLLRGCPMLSLCCKPCAEIAVLFQARDLAASNGPAPTCGMARRCALLLAEPSSSSF